MTTVRLQRIRSGPHGTFGVLRAPGWTALSIECPWRDNRRTVSCVPSGRYKVATTYSPRFGRPMLHVLDVPDRSGIRFHSGNLAGDREAGLRSHFAGCIGIGERAGVLAGQRAVLSSSPAVRRLEALREFELIVEGEPWTS